MQTQVMIDGETADAFPLAHGVKQGCVLAPTLFSLFLAAVLEVSNRNTTKGVQCVPPQTILDGFAAASAYVGLSINVRKTEVLHQPASGTPYLAPTILFNGTPLNVATTFKTLGAPSQTTAASTRNCRLEFSRRLPRSDDYAKYYGTNTTSSLLVIKCKVYHAIILSCLTYSSETYTLYRRHIQRLSQIHLRHLRAILGIR